MYKNIENIQSANMQSNNKLLFRNKIAENQKSSIVNHTIKHAYYFLSIGLASLFLFSNSSSINYTYIKNNANKNISYQSAQNSFALKQHIKTNENQYKLNKFSALGLIKHITNKFNANTKNNKENKLPIGIAAYGINLHNNNIIPDIIKTNEITGVAKINAIAAESGDHYYGASLQLNVTLKVNSNKIRYYFLQNVIVFNTAKKSISLNDSIYKTSKDHSIQIHADQIKLGKGKIHNSNFPFINNNFYYYNGKMFDYSLPMNLVLSIAVKKENNGLLIDFAYNCKSKQNKETKMIAKTFDDVFLKVKDLKSFYILISPKIIKTKNGWNALDAEFVYGGEDNGKNAVFSSMSSQLNLFYKKNNNLQQFPFVLNFGCSTGETTSNLNDYFNEKGIAVISKGKMELTHFLKTK